MKRNCYTKFYKSLKKEVNPEFSQSVRDLIDTGNLTEKTLADLIKKEVEDE